MRKLIVVCSMLLVSTLAGWAQQAETPKIQLVVGITGEHGVVALKEGVISMYSSKSIGIVGKDGRKARLVEAKSGVVSLTLNGSRWDQTQEHLGLSAASTPALCDRLNQINLSSTVSSIAQALPKGARIKTHLEGNGFEVVVYTTSKAPIRYDVQVGLLKRGGGGKYTLLNTHTATEFGSFCGIQDAGNGQYFVLVDEPSGSSDYLAVYVYSVNK